MEHCSRKRLLWVPVTAVTILAAFLVSCGGGPFLGPVRTFGPALRSGDRVFLLTGQWRTLFSLDDEGPRETDLFVDLWAFDAATAKPLWRRRLQTERNGAMAGRSILGAEGSTLWLLLPRGVVAASLTDGAIQADGARIEARNPQLKGLLPKEHRYFQFGPTRVDDHRRRRPRVAAGRWNLLGARREQESPDRRARRHSADILYAEFLANVPTARAELPGPLAGRSHR